MIHRTWTVTTERRYAHTVFLSPSIECVLGIIGWNLQGISHKWEAFGPGWKPSGYPLAYAGHQKEYKETDQRGQCPCVHKVRNKHQGYPRGSNSSEASSVETVSLSGPSTRRTRLHVLSEVMRFASKVPWGIFCLREHFALVSANVNIQYTAIHIVIPYDVYQRLLGSEMNVLGRLACTARSASLVIFLMPHMQISRHRVRP